MFFWDTVYKSFVLNFCVLCVVVYAAKTWYSTYVRCWTNSYRGGGPAGQLSMSLTVLYDTSWWRQVQGIVLGVWSEHCIFY